MKTRGSVRKEEREGPKALEADTGDDDDLLLDQLAIAMRRRLIKVRTEADEIAAPRALGKEVATAREVVGKDSNAGVEETPAGREPVGSLPEVPANGVAPGEANDEGADGFMALEERGFTKWSEAEIKASLAKATWVPRTGLPLPLPRGPGTAASRSTHGKEGEKEKGRKKGGLVVTKGRVLEGAQGSNGGEIAGHLSGERSGEHEDGGASGSAAVGRESLGQGRGREKAATPSRIGGALAGLEKQLLIPPKDHRKELREAQKRAKQSAGHKWFDLPAQTITPEVRQELRLLKLRGTLDPKRHYKAPDSTKFPKFFQMGTVVESAADFYTGRLTKRERKGSFAGELLADAKLKGYRKRKYAEIQAEKDLKSRRHYKKQIDKKKPSWART